VLRICADGSPQPLADELEYVKFSCLAWSHDGLGFFYNRCVCVGRGVGGSRLAA
jgi:prolyl oligopeptidase